MGPTEVGWRLLRFLALYGVLLGGLALVRAGGVRALGELYRNQAHMTMTPLVMGGSEAVNLIVLCIVVAVIGRWERRGFDDYGLPLRFALKRNFWIGSLTGFLTISSTLLGMFLLHGFRVTNVAIHGTEIVSSLVGWGVAFLLVGRFEEFLFRGYIQYTLTSAIGYWPAAWSMSCLFGLGHFLNSNENLLGSVVVVLFGLLLCLFLRRTGDLWCAVGFHLGYDWGQMLFGVPDSGIPPYHNLLSSSSSGPQWLTGGVVGPEASVLTPVALLVVAIVFSRRYPEIRYPAPRLRAES
jgi:membrane protease YdiL (CAAX protease family)